MEHTYLCLQFDKFWIWSWCKDRKRKPFKSAESGYLQKIVKLNQVNLFSAEFSRLEPLWAVAFFSFFISFLRFATNCSWCDGISRTTQNGCWHQCIRDICSYRWPHWEIRQKKGNLNYVFNFFTLPLSVAKLLINWVVHEIYWPIFVVENTDPWLILFIIVMYKWI